MEPKKKYGRYLWDLTCNVPARSRHRLKEKSAASNGNPPSPPRNIDTEHDIQGCSNFTAEAFPTNPVYNTADEEMPINSEPGPGRSESIPDPDCDDSDAEEELIRSPAGSGWNSPHSYSCPNSSDNSTSDGADVLPDKYSDLGQVLYSGSRITKAESMLLILGHILRHEDSKEATESLLKLVEAHLPRGTEFPTTKYTFFKHFGNTDVKRSRHFYCSSCYSHIGTLEEVTDVLCKKCKTELQVQDLVKSSSYFFFLDIAAQICDILKVTDLMPVQTSVSYDITNITNSIGYRKLPIGPDDVSLTFNTDGVPLFESSGVGIWPLLAQINELPYKDRAKKLLLVGLWFGPRKPPMNTFLLPFVQTMNTLSAAGVTWEDSNGHRRTTKVFPGPCTVDSVARCELMGMTQFNGKRGCNWWIPSEAPSQCFF
ncbi:uncharacterized protein LOC135384453 [Ornithodoros turicata]|uniref:uncharacterized protein LOC135384453 n=1 Tax=Ornithodoros turicata TaxID=34597 RepID=UPI003139E88D